MKIRCSRQRTTSYGGPLLAVGVFQGKGPMEGMLRELDQASKGWVHRILGSGDFRGKLGEAMVQHTSGALRAARVLFLGLGEPHKFCLDRWRGCASRAAQVCRSLRLKQLGLSLALPPGAALPPADLASAAAEGALLGLYRFGALRSEKPEEPEPEEMVLLGGGRGGVERAAAEAQVISEAVCWVRDLVTHPGNRMTPAVLAERAAAMARTWGIRCTILDEREIRALGMGGLLGVAAGSREPPRFIVLEHLGADRRGPRVVLVGKGITFDSGGISLKPAEKMDRMKDDMAGGAAVMGALQAAARLALPVNVVGIVPATENLPSGSAYKPGDVLTTHSGKTIEVTNTDAEGRVVLSDALAYARRFKPALIIDLATLTGACVVALGELVAGMMGTSPAALEALQAAGERTGEDVWPLPLKEEYEEYIESDIADVKNSGGREAGAIQGGLFLKKFVGDTPWVHVDIAGPVWTDKDRPYRPKGATGFGVRLLVEFLRQYKGRGWRWDGRRTERRISARGRERP
jgi:leucyl aminopeptidase